MNGSWRTSLVGALVAILVAVQPLITTGQIDWKAVGIAALIALFGFLSKDSNVTGGTKDNGQRLMKKAGMIILLLGLGGLSVNAQSHNGFFKPLDQSMFGAKDLKSTTVWLFRPAVNITAYKLTYNKDLKQLDQQAFSSAGLGGGLQHYTEVNGMPYNDYGFNAILLLGISTTENKANLGIAATVNALKILNFGIGYDFTGKNPFLLTGVNILNLIDFQ
jgi:hypothetical protein